MSKHIIFFDSECPLCHKAVAEIILMDKKKIFRFAPLNGNTAAHTFTGPNKRYLKMNSMVLVEDHLSTHRRFFARSKAFLRTYWLIGSKWKLLGLLSFLPSFLGDFIYKNTAEHRHQFKLKMGNERLPTERLLP